MVRRDRLLWCVRPWHSELIGMKNRSLHTLYDPLRGQSTVTRLGGGLECCLIQTRSKKIHLVQYLCDRKRPNWPQVWVWNSPFVTYYITQRDQRGESDEVSLMSWGGFKTTSKSSVIFRGSSVSYQLSMSSVCGVETFIFFNVNFQYLLK